MELNRDRVTLCLDFATFYLCVREPKVREGNRGGRRKESRLIRTGLSTQTLGMAFCLSHLRSLHLQALLLAMLPPLR